MRDTVGLPEVSGSQCLPSAGKPVDASNPAIGYPVITRTSTSTYGGPTTRAYSGTSYSSTNYRVSASGL